MSLDHWLAFVAASAILLAIPGPTVLLVVSYALGHGRKAAAAIVAGVALGDFTAMTASMLGLGALIASSASAFAILRLIGAAYLIYLGIKLWRAPVEAAAASAPEPARPWRMFAHAYAVTALNPKGIVFFVAFVPQFLVTSEPLLAQIILLEATFLAMASLNALGYALLSSAARGALGRPATRGFVNRAGGSLLIGVGILAAGWRRAN